MKKEILSIQYARAFAAMFIVIYHVTRKGMLLGYSSFEFHLGAMSVTLFFMISGYIMSYIQENKNISFKNFIINRCIRILPLYYIYTILILIIYIIRPGLVHYSHHPEISILGSFIIYPGNDKSLLLNPGWTLRPEMVYYLIFGLIMLTSLSYKKILSSTILLCICLSVISHIVGNKTLSNFTSPLFLFSIGMIIYKINNIFDFKKILFPKSFLFTMVMVSYFFLETHDNSCMSSILIIAILFISILSTEGIILKKSHFGKLIYELGQSSYSIYLTHVFAIGAITFIAKKITLNYSLFISVGILLSIAIGYASYIFIEKPVTKFLRGKISLKNNDRLNIKTQS